MPELPEVETIVRDLRPGLTGRRLEKVSLLHHDVLRDVTPRGLVRGLTGATVRGVERRAKHAVLDLGERRFVVQPGMTGVLVLHERPLKKGEDRHVVLRARLDDGRELVYRDIRRFGTLLLLDANPLADVANVTKRSGVMVRGRWVPESEIQRGLADLARKFAN